MQDPADALSTRFLDPAGQQHAAGTAEYLGRTRDPAHWMDWWVIASSLHQISPLLFLFSARGYILLWIVQPGLLHLCIHASCSEEFKTLDSSRLLVLPLLGMLLVPEAVRDQDLGRVLSAGQQYPALLVWQTLASFSAADSRSIEPLY